MVLERLTVLFAGVVVLPFLLPPYVPLEPAWEISAGLGYLACAAGAVCCALGWRRRIGSWPVAVPRALDVHRLGGHVVWLATLGHVAVMLAFDPAVLEYLTWTMPWDVVAGFAATGALAVVVLTKTPRRRPALRRLRLPSAHVVFTLVFVALTVFHVAFGQSKLIESWQIPVVLGGLVVTALPSLLDRLSHLLEWAVGRPLPGYEPHLNRVRIERISRRHAVSLGLLLALVFLCATLPAHLRAWL